MPSATYTPLANVTLSSTASSVTFSSISQSYRDLVLVIQNSASSGSYLFYNFNGTTTAIYPAVYMGGDGSSAYSSTNNFNYFDISFGIGSASGLTVISNIMDYSATDKHKTVLTRTNKSSAGVAAGAGRWANTAAITQISVNQGGYDNFAAGSTFALYGIAS